MHQIVSKMMFPFFGTPTGNGTFLRRSPPNYVFHITCNTRWSAVTAKVTAATTTRTQMQLSRKLMRRLYRSSPWEFSESLWTN